MATTRIGRILVRTDVGKPYGQTSDERDYLLLSFIPNYVPKQGKRPSYFGRYQFWREQVFQDDPTYTRHTWRQSFDWDPDWKEIPLGEGAQIPYELERAIEAIAWEFKCDILVNVRTVWLDPYNENATNCQSVSIEISLFGLEKPIRKVYNFLDGLANRISKVARECEIAARQATIELV